MKELHEITVSLDKAKKLKEAGYPQDSLFYKHIELDGNGQEKTSSKEILSRHRLKDDIWKYWISAPTTDELLERLPLEIETESSVKTENVSFIFQLIFQLNIRYDGASEFMVQYDGHSGGVIGEEIYGKKLCDALADMYNYLSENNLLKAGE